MNKNATQFAPELVLDVVAPAVEFYKKAFGAEEELIVKNDDGSISFITIDPGTDGFEFVVGNRAGKRVLIIRDGHTFVPVPDTRIESGDELLIVTTSKTRAAAESRLRAVSRRGKLAYWFDEYGEAG